MTEAQPGWDNLPTETEIYILPTGEIVVADLPDELAWTLRLPYLHPPRQAGPETDHPDANHKSHRAQGTE